MPSHKDGYISYLLRLRQMPTDNRFVWVASVQNTATGEQRCFVGINALTDFLWVEFGGDEAAPDFDRPAT